MKKKVASFATVVILSTSITTNTQAATYTIQKGDTLASIANKHHVSVSQIKKINNLKSDALYFNQVLKLASSASTNTQTNTAKAPLSQSGSTYTVVKGDSLIKISNQYNISLAELKVWNNLTKDNIFIGQRLVVSKSTEPSTEKKKESIQPPSQTLPPSSNGIYVIKSGDSLSKIAAQFKLTVDQLKTMNNMSNDLIFAGQTLNVGEQVLSAVEQKPSNHGNEKEWNTDNLLIIEATNLIDTPYVYGGSSPDAFDCSGFIYYVFNKAGQAINRLSSEGYYNRSYYVDTPKIGDLVFFSNTYKSGISHMGIYIGDNQFIHASPSNGVVVSDLNTPYYQKHFEAFKRFY